VPEVQTMGLPSLVHEALGSPGQRLDPVTRSFMGARFGHDFSQVRVHTDDKASASAQAVEARAYTVGQDIVFGSGQYRPQASGFEDRVLLAHELTHVVQQTMLPGQSTSPADDRGEQEARQNSQRVTAGLASRALTPQTAGSLQRQDKKKPEGGLSIERGFEKKPEEAKNKFSFSADLTVPLTPGLRLGPLFFLEDLKLQTKGSKESEMPIPISGTDIASLQTQIALGIARLEVPKLKLPANLGTLSLGAKLGATGSLTQKFGEGGGLGGSLGTSASLEAGYKSPSLLPSSMGSLTLGTSLGASGSLTEKFGQGGGFTPKVGAKAGLEASYKSPASTSPFLTLGGLLGEQASLSLGATAGLSSEFTPEKGSSAKLSTSGTLGLTGTRPKGPETFIKLKISGDAGLNLATGDLEAKSQSFFLGLTGGFKFKGL